MIGRVHSSYPAGLLIGIGLGALFVIVLLIAGIVCLFRSGFTWLAALAIVLIVVGGWAAFGQDFRGIEQLQREGHHGQGHAQHHDWYKDLKQPGTGYGCCDNQDCRPTRAYQDEAGLWRAQLDGQWITVPPRVVLKELAPDGNSHICASRSGLIFCFIGGSPKS